MSFCSEILPLRVLLAELVEWRLIPADFGDDRSVRVRRRAGRDVKVWNGAGRKWKHAPRGGTGERDCRVSGRGRRDEVCRFWRADRRGGADGLDDLDASRRERHGGDVGGGGGVRKQSTGVG